MQQNPKKCLSRSCSCILSAMILAFLLPPASLPKRQNLNHLCLIYKVVQLPLVKLLDLKRCSAKFFTGTLLSSLTSHPVFFVQAAKYSYKKNRHVSLCSSSNVVIKMLRKNCFNKCVDMPRYNNKIGYWESILLPSAPYNSFIEN